ncbi:universal stress protein [Flavimarina sp. Hel_I_48]|uniref:universal stress protein n=1 Tax=Flavimarina sp. Hel_I_48 TaxID=1392488 RepID=UPI0004DF9EB5|nr:universal stress protein [Flavimarina sp. Hel_I_48]
MNKILVPTDFSEQAMYALEIAVQLAKRYNAKIYLLHLLEMPEMLGDGPLAKTSELPEALFFMRLAHKKFDSILELPLLQDVEIIEAAEFYGAFEGIMEYVNKYEIDGIVMGSHGAKGIQELFIGSNTEKVVRHSKVPVLVIKSQNLDFKIKNFVFATDLQEDNIEPVRKALKFAHKEKATFQLVYINTPNRFKTTLEIMNNFNKFVEYLGTSIDNFTIFNDQTIERGILNFINYKNVELLGIGTHGRKGLSHFFNGSISQDLVNHAKRPVITFNI